MVAETTFSLNIIHTDNHFAGEIPLVYKSKVVGHLDIEIINN
jgi:hypothetical protein